MARAKVYTGREFPVGAVVHCLSRKGPLGIVVAHDPLEEGGVRFMVAKLDTGEPLGFRGRELVARPDLQPTAGFVTAQLALCGIGMARVG